MLFYTPEFVFFILCTLALYYWLPQYRLYTLVLANIIFYAVTGISMLVLFMAVAAVTYGLSILLSRSRQKLYLLIGILINLSNLLFFKYSLFILSNFEKLLGLPILNHAPFITNLVLPVGISFYTFELIAYLVDVYKGKLDPTRNMLIFWVFISFFPHRIAGPIMRGKDLIPQVEHLKQINFSSATFSLGLTYLAMGMVKKIFIADNIAVFVNNFYSQGIALTGSQAWIAGLLYTFQIYYDFSAYSEMAVGIGYLFGIQLDLNFKTPYLSGNPSEFWRRWHITLSTWIRDYIYIPLGGSRKGDTRKYINLFAAMAISGLWHGAAWTFVIWGMYHGLLQICHNLYAKLMKCMGWGKLTDHWIYKAVSILVMFNLANIGWIFFRSDNLSIAIHMISSMLTTNLLYLDSGMYNYALAITGLFILHIVEYWARKYYRRLLQLWSSWIPVPLRAAAYTALIVALVVYAPTDHSSFIYFKF